MSASSNEYEQQRFFEESVLHPAIVHMNSKFLDKEQISIINKMVEIAFNTKTNK